MDYVKDVKNLLDEIILLLLSVNEKNWCKPLKKIREEYELSTTSNKQRIITDIIGIYGGMGSFSDLILHKEGKVLKGESTKLDHLRRKLFDTIKVARQ